MAESDFSWLKLLSFFGVGILAFLCFAVIASGIMFITMDKTFNGVVVILAGIVCGACTVLLYNYYQKKSYNGKIK